MRGYPDRQPHFLEPTSAASPTSGPVEHVEDHRRPAPLLADRALRRRRGLAQEYAEPLLADAQRRPADHHRAAGGGQAAFDRIRASVNALKESLARRAAAARRELVGVHACEPVFTAMVVAFLRPGWRWRCCWPRRVRPLDELARPRASVADGALRPADARAGPGRHPRGRAGRGGDADPARRRSSEPARSPAPDSTPGDRAAPLQRRARAVRLRRLARPAGAAAQGRQLLPAAGEALRRPARRARPSSTSTSRSTAPSGCRR